MALSQYRQHSSSARDFSHNSRSKQRHLKVQLRFASVGYILGSITQIIFFDMPMVFVIIAYPLVCYKTFFKSRNTTRVSPNSATRPASTVPGHLSHPANEPQAARKEKKVRLCGKSVHGSLTGFATLTLMTTSVVICLMPNEIYYTILIFAEVDLPRFFAVADILKRLTIVFDPMLVVLGNTELRKMVVTWLFCTPNNGPRVSNLRKSLEIIRLDLFLSDICFTQ